MPTLTPRFACAACHGLNAAPVHSATCPRWPFFQASRVPKASQSRVLRAEVRLGDVDVGLDAPDVRIHEAIVGSSREQRQPHRGMDPGSDAVSMADGVRFSRICVA